MKQLINGVSRTLRPFGIFWHLARSAYLIVSGTYAGMAYYNVRQRLNVRGLQKHGAKCLAIVSRICDGLGVRAILVCGSLLGYVRDGHFGSSSKDIDLQVFSDELLDVDLLVDQMKRSGFQLHRTGRLQGPLEKIGRLFLLQFHHPAYYVSVDIYIVHRFEEKIVYVEDRSVDYLYREYLRDTKAYREPYLGYIRFFSPEIYSEYKQVEFEGSRVWIPSQPMRLLQIIYGFDGKSDVKNIFKNMLLIQQGPREGTFEYVKPR